MDLDDEIKKAQQERKKALGAVGLADFSTGGGFDAELYGSGSSEYVHELVEEEDDDAVRQRAGGYGGSHPATRASSLPQKIIAEMQQEMEAAGGAADPMLEFRQKGGSGIVNTRISDREDSYHARGRQGRMLSPERAPSGEGGAAAGRSYAEIMQEQQLQKEKAELMRKLEKQKQDAALLASASVGHYGSAAAAAAAGGAGGADATPVVAPGATGTLGGKKRRRWDDAEGAAGAETGQQGGSSVSSSSHYHPQQKQLQQQQSFDALDQGGAGGSAAGVADWEDALTVTASSRAGAASAGGAAAASAGGASVSRRGRRWDVEDSSSAVDGGAGADSASIAGRSQISAASGLTTAAAGGGSVRRSRWDVGTGGGDADATPLHYNAADAVGATPDLSAARERRWGSSSTSAGSVAGFSIAGTEAAGAGAAAGAFKKKSRWDETPTISSGGGLGAGDATPMLGAGAGGATPLSYGGATPNVAALAGSATPLVGAGGATPSRAELEMEERNRPLSDDELDALFPEGYKVLDPPASYVPIHTPSRKLMGTPSQAAGATPGFKMTDTPQREAYGIPVSADEMTASGQQAGGAGAGLPYIKPEDMQFFGALLDGRPEEDMDADELRERRIMKLLLKIKNGLPPVRKLAMRQLAEKSREFGAGPVFNQLLPLLLSPTLEEQERHLLVKVIDKVMGRLQELVRPYAHKILGIVEPMLIDEDYYARVEGREIISNLAKAAGLATMIATMRPDIDHSDEYVRNTTSRAFAVVASALGITALLPFLKAVCSSKKSWQARHTGVKIVQQIAILMGSAVLPQLKLLVDIAGPALQDEQQKVRTMSALALAALAEAAHPYGIEAFDSVLRPLWKGVKEHRGKALASFLKAIGFIIPLMEPRYASYYTREIMATVIREFATPDEEMKKIVLAVVKQCVGTEGVEAEYVRTDILPDFFKHFWVRRMALDRRNYRALVETTVSLANKVGAGAIVSRLADDLKDESEPYRKMVMETVERVVSSLGASDIDPRLEELLLDGLLYAFQEQTAEDSSKIMLSGFATVVNALGQRTKPYLAQIAATIKWRLNNKQSQIRLQSADLLARVAAVMKVCGEDALLGHLGIVLYECLGEEYPDVLGSILGGLTAIVQVIGMASMQPPIKDLLPRLTPILKNRHDKVQENCIQLVGRIADRGAKEVPSKEWMRICFELLEMLRAPRKSIRRACVNTFGYIAKAIGPQDVLYALLNNLKVQERTMRVCTTIAIAIVAETCQPFTILPGLLNEYRVPELHVQNGVLKALSFMFEYIGPMARDYAYSVCGILEDALMDRDLIHRQTACFAVKHLALGLQGRGCEDVLQHLLNYVWPNILETYPHTIQACMEALEGLRVSLGPAAIFRYVLQGLFHPAKKVREVYWKIYNNLYVYSVDALTPILPRLEEVDPLPLSLEEVAAKAGILPASGGAKNGALAGGAAAAAEESEEQKQQREKQKRRLLKKGKRYARTHLELLL